MTETERILRLLGRRVVATGFYQTEPVVGGGGQPACLTIHLEDAIVVVYVDDDSTGRARTALSFLSKHMNLNAIHLNQWARPEARTPVTTLVTDLWRTFWTHEIENRALGRIQWMHGPDLPWLEEDVEVQLDLPFEEEVTPVDEVLAANVDTLVDALDELLASVVAGSPERPAIMDVIDIFGDW